MVLSNRAHIAEQQDSYRRGLVLGLTMAEIVILIIFVLLLAMAALIKIEIEKRQEAERKILSAEQSIVRLVEKFSNLEEITGSKDIEKFVRELVAAQEELKNILEVQSQLSEATSLIEQYEAAAKENGVVPDPEKVAVALKEAKENKEALAEIGDKSGKGNAMPPCWATDKGSVEFIFEVAITNEGMILRETILPHRNTERKRLPTSLIILNQETSSAKFKTMVEPLWKWSEDKKCRFYVKVFDEIATTFDEKNIYKKRLKTVERRFYRHFTIFKNFHKLDKPQN